MLSTDLESRQDFVGSRHSSPRFNRTKFQPYDPFALPQTPKTRPRPLSPELELQDSIISLHPSNSRPESRDGRLARSLIRSGTPPSPRISSPQYKHRIASSPLPIRGSSGLDTSKGLASRSKSMRNSRNSRSRSPLRRYNLDYDSPLSLTYPPFSRPKSPLSPTNYRYGYGGTVDSSSSSVFVSPQPSLRPKSPLSLTNYRYAYGGTVDSLSSTVFVSPQPSLRPKSPLSPTNYRYAYGGTVDSSPGAVLVSPRPRYHPHVHLQDLSSSFFSPPKDQLSPTVQFAIQESQEIKKMQPFKTTSPVEDSQLVSAPKPPPQILSHETSDVESRHTPEVHSLPPTTSSPVNSKQGFDSPITPGGDSDPQIPHADEPERYTLKNYAEFFITDTLPRQLYLLFLFRLPALYFLRVARIFEEADLTLGEIEEMAVTTVTANGHEENLNPDQTYDRLKKAWELLINRFVSEWQTFNVVSVLLLPAIVSIFQIDGATNDPITRYMAFWSLICALLSSLYDCLFIICFPTMRKPHKAAAWAFEALKAQEIFWNVWVMLAMPAVWMCWSILTFIVCIMSFMWRARAGLPSDYDFDVSPSIELGMRIFICVVLATGAAYGFFIFRTLNRFGSRMDRTWRLRAEAFSAPPMPRTMAILPPEYRATDEPVAGGSGPRRLTGDVQDRVGPGSPCQDRAKQSTPNSSNSPPAYPTPANHTTYSKASNHTSVAPSFQPLAIHKSSKQQKVPPNGEADISRKLPSARSVSPHHRQAFTGSRPSDVQKVLDEERGRSPISHSRSRPHLRNQVDYVVESSRTLEDSPQVGAKRSNNKKGQRVSGDPFLLDFGINDGDILLDEIPDIQKARLSTMNGE